ncbi:MAG: helix-turn-helix domain-containing protein [Lachnospiraceae bacterium]|nr:helix-turn-helix domain-containing protein [Lachnospiraceae bacterium]
MEKTHYSISEACKDVGVESHVLRYWEDELHLEIPRNGKNHRYYTELHIRLFQKIKELKEKGYQLKAIEQVLERMIAGDDTCDPDEVLEQNAVTILKEGSAGEAMEGEAKLRMVPKKENGGGVTAANPDKMEQFQQIMNQIIRNAIGQAIQENNETLSEEISRQVNDKMVQELEYMMRISDEREEERFKILDETLRAYQKDNKGRAEAAAARLPFFKKKKFGRGGKKLS